MKGLALAPNPDASAKGQPSANVIEEGGGQVGKKRKQNKSAPACLRVIFWLAHKPSHSKMLLSLDSQDLVVSPLWLSICASVATTLHHLVHPI